MTDKTDKTPLGLFVPGRRRGLRKASGGTRRESSDRDRVSPSSFAACPPRREQGSPLLYDLICPRQDWLWDYEADGSRGLEVDHQLELRRLLERQIGGLGALEDLVDEDRRAPAVLHGIRTIGDQPAGLDIRPECTTRLHEEP